MPPHCLQPLFYTKSRLTASSHENDILTKYSNQAIHSLSQQNARWLFSNNTTMHDWVCCEPPCFPGTTEVKRVSSVSEEDPLRPLLLNPELEPWASAPLEQLLAPSTPCRESRLGSWITRLSFYISTPISGQHRASGWMKWNTEEIEISLCGLQSCAFWTTTEWEALKIKLGSPGQQKGRQQKPHRWHGCCKWCNEIFKLNAHPTDCLCC